MVERAGLNDKYIKTTDLQVSSCIAQSRATPPLVVESAMQSEVLEVQEFANQMLRHAEPGMRGDASNPAMTTPAFVTAAQFVIQGSTICLIC